MSGNWTNKLNVLCVKREKQNIRQFSIRMTISKFIYN